MGILVQRVVNPRSIVIRNKFFEDPTQVRLAKYNHMVEAFPSDRADQPLHVPILPRRARRNGLVANAHGPQSAPQRTAKALGIKISNDLLSVLSDAVEKVLLHSRSKFLLAVHAIFL